MTARKFKNPPRPPRSAIERQAAEAWKRWGDGYSLCTVCDSCGEFRPCRGKHRHPMLCLECWDQKGGTGS